jgi:hypothetical protein
MNILDHISESCFWVKILKFFNADADPNPGIFLTLVLGWKKFLSGINTVKYFTDLQELRVELQPGADEQQQAGQH